MIDLVFTLCLMVLSFIVGVMVCQRSTVYRMGRKVVDDVQLILNHRKVTGDGTINLTATTCWEHEGRDYKMVIEQKPQR